MNKRLMTGLVTGGLLAAMLSGAGTAIAADVECGDVVTTDIKLTHDLGPCTGDGIVAGASGIRIDLGGHTITGDGDGLGGGVRIQSPHRNVEVRRGTITGFNEGVVLSGTRGNHIWRLSLVGNNRGVDLAGFNDRNLVEKNLVRDSAGDGIRVDVSSENTVRKNRLSGNAYGISVSNGANDNRIIGNRVSSGPKGFSFGISVFSDSDRNLVTKNRVRGMAFEGILVQSSSDDTRVAKNISSHNGRDGVLIEPAGGPYAGDPMRSVLLKNRAFRNGDDGIDIDSAVTTLTKNKADRNGDLGIEAVAGVTDGGGNKARRNGDSTECTNIACR